MTREYFKTLLLTHAEIPHDLLYRFFVESKLRKVTIPTMVFERLLMSWCESKLLRMDWLHDNLAQKLHEFYKMDRTLLFSKDGMLIKIIINEE